MFFITLLQRHRQLIAKVIFSRIEATESYVAGIYLSSFLGHGLCHASAPSRDAYINVRCEFGLAQPGSKWQHLRLGRFSSTFATHICCCHSGVLKEDAKEEDWVMLIAQVAF